MGRDIPKQFLSFNNRSILNRSVGLFAGLETIDKKILVAHPDFIERTAREAEPYLTKDDIVCPGGQTRHQSFLYGVKQLDFDEDDIILIHDAARPFLTDSEIQELIETTSQKGVATLADSVTDTIVYAEEKVVKKIRDREKKYLIKTPQGIRGRELAFLLEQNIQTEPTDLCSWAIQSGLETIIVLTNPYNIKITRPEDLKKAEMYENLLKDLTSKSS